MTQTSDRINEALVAHEHLAPNEELVLARARAIADTMRRRRWVVRATGSAVVGAGVVAGSVGIPAWLSHSAARDTVRIVPLDTGSPSPTAVPHTVGEALAAYFAAGYDYNDAVQLGQMWNETDITKVKAEAGAKLIDGETLPIQPSAPNQGVDPQTAAAVKEFFDAGYDYNDAVQLGKMWNETDLFQVKAEAGKKLMAGQVLPIGP